MQADILFMSTADIFIMFGCIFIMPEQSLFFIIAVFDIRLHDIIMFISAADIFMPAIDLCFIESCFLRTEGGCRSEGKNGRGEDNRCGLHHELKNELTIIL